MWNGRNGQSQFACLEADEQTASSWLGAVTGWAGVRDARSRQQAAVKQFGLFALSANDLDWLMNEAVTLVAETLHVEYCKVLELLPGGKELRLRWGVGWKEGTVGYATVHNDAESQDGYTLLAQAALLSKEPVIVEDLHKETRFKGSRLLLDHGVTSGLSTAIQGPIKPFGVLGAHTTRQRRFTQEDGNFIQSVADILAAAIARLETERISQDAQAKMKTLRGLIPICASCKQIRDDRGYWKHIEKYICDHADVRFSHGICPDCFQRLYPDINPALPATL
jgi:GAF domain-containing protein